MNPLIGLSGLKVAQTALEVIGANIANANTEGYHRETLQLAPTDFNSLNKVPVGGAIVRGTIRQVDALIEEEITRQQIGMGQNEQILTTLQSIEGALGELGSDDLSAAINKFFSSMSELSSSPTDLSLQQQAVTSGEAMADQFRRLSDFFESAKNEINVKAQNYINQMNSLVGEIAELNAQIGAGYVRGASTGLLQDRRDQAVNELASLADVSVETQGRSDGMVNVIVWGTPMVVGSRALTAELQQTSDGFLGFAVEGDAAPQTNVRGGGLGAMFALYNDILPDLGGRLDSLAGEIITQINRMHAVGVGPAGAFTELSGWQVGSGVLSTETPDVVAGTIYVRVTDASTQESTRVAISVNPAADTLASVQARFDAAAHLGASVVGGELHITADDGYTFDFLPALMSEPTTSAIAGTSAATVSGVYTGTSNQTYSCTVEGSGTVGVTENLDLVVRNGAGSIVRTLNLGQGYSPGESLEIDDGVRVSLSSGTLTDGDVFTVQALADSDPTGLLAAIGLNTFFKGSDAGNIAVCERILEDPQCLASSLSATLSDNLNVLRMSNLGESALGNLQNSTPANYYRDIVTNIGQQITTQKARQASQEAVYQQLTQQRDKISGVDINEESAKLLVFERMYQAMAKFISVQDKATDSLMQIL